MRCIQKQPSRGVLRNSCFENMQQIYRRTPMPKCDFEKVTLREFHTNYKVNFIINKTFWNCTLIYGKLKLLLKKHIV